LVGAVSSNHARGSSPTGKEGSRYAGNPYSYDEPSLTVGLLPRA